MIGYIIRRLLVAVIVVLGIIAISFAMLYLLAPSPVYAVLGAKAQPEAVKVWNLQHGYDRPEIAQFFTYLGHLLHLNFGYSYKLDQGVGALFAENAGRSAYLSGASLVLALIIAIPLGIAQAVRRNSAFDYTVTIYPPLGTLTLSSSTRQVPASSRIRSIPETWIRTPFAPTIPAASR